MEYKFNTAVHGLTWKYEDYCPCEACRHEHEYQVGKEIDRQVDEAMMERKGGYIW